VYPQTIHFVQGSPGIAGVLISWKPPANTEVIQYLIFRSSQAIAPEDTETFYRGELPTRQWQVSAQEHQFQDPQSPEPGWFLVLAQNSSGDLYAVEFSVEAALEEESKPSLYKNPPDLIFRETDKDAAKAMERTTGSLSRVFDSNNSD